MNAAVAEADAPVAAPALDIHLLKVDHVHLCAGVKKISGGIEIAALCQPAIRKTISAIHAVGENGGNLLFFQNAPRPEGAELAPYSVLVPRALLTRKLSFQVVSQSGDVYPAFTASRRKLKLPAGWQFSPYFLNLTYDPASEGKAAAPAPVGAFIHPRLLDRGRRSRRRSVGVPDRGRRRGTGARHAGDQPRRVGHLRGGI